jgi:hypothetical protein
VVVWICSVVMKAVAVVETTKKKRNTLLDSAMLGILHSSYVTMYHVQMVHGFDFVQSSISLHMPYSLCYFESTWKADYVSFFHGHVHSHGSSSEEKP